MNTKVFILTVILGLSALYYLRSEDGPVKPKTDDSLSHLHEWYSDSFEEIESVSLELGNQKCDEVLVDENALKERGEACAEILKKHPIKKRCLSFPKERTTAGMALFLFLCGNEEEYKIHTQKR